MKTTPARRLSLVPLLFSGVPALGALTLIVTSAAMVGCGGNTPGMTGTDMAGGTGGLTLKNLPTGCPATETAADLYTTVVLPKCAIPGCHAANGTSFSITSAADMHTKWVGVKSSLYAAAVSFPYVTANNSSQSFLLYKLTNSQGNNGGQMPVGGALSSSEICKFVSWINSGAP